MEEEKDNTIARHNAEGNVIASPFGTNVLALLKRTREEKGVSLQETEAATRIPVHYLRMLEGDGDERLLADALYLIPFLRTYSAFLALDPAHTVAQFISLMHQKEKADEAVIHSPHQSSRFGIASFVIALLLILLGFLWIFQGGR